MVGFEVTPEAKHDQRLATATTLLNQRWFGQTHRAKVCETVCEQHPMAPRKNVHHDRNHPSLHCMEVGTEPEELTGSGVIPERID